MLQFQCLKNHAGLMLCGDYLSLRELHDVLHEVNESSPLIRNEEGELMSLAYDVRKAFQQKREVLGGNELYPEIGPRFGVKALWPTLLFQCSLLRAALGFFDSSKRHQAMAFWLEGLVIDGLHSDFKAAAPAIVNEWKRLDPKHMGVEGKLSGRTVMFCYWSKRERRQKLANLLRSLDPMYDQLYNLPGGSGEENLIPPEAFADFEGVQCPDPRW